MFQKLGTFAILETRLKSIEDFTQCKERVTSSRRQTLPAQSPICSSAAANSCSTLLSKAHLDQIHEPVSERLQTLAQIRKLIADNDSNEYRDQNLDIKDPVPRFLGMLLCMGKLEALLAPPVNR